MKHLHHKALDYDIGVYFEANGHGTVSIAQITSTLKYLEITVIHHNRICMVWVSEHLKKHSIFYRNGITDWLMKNLLPAGAIFLALSVLYFDRFPL